MQDAEVIESEIKTVWKVGSRWSYDGNWGSSILDIFKRHSVVFVGKSHHLFMQIGAGNLIAVADGVTVVALGRVNVPPKPLADYGIPFDPAELARLNLDENERDEVLACRVEYLELKPEDRFYGGRRTIHRLYQERGKAIKLYLQYRDTFRNRQEFEIKARSCTLAHNPAHPQDILWHPEICYRIPVFQRPYSWGEPEARRLVNDLLMGCFGRNGRTSREPMFIGTMQITEPAITSRGKFTISHDVIDGQQRLTTLILILRALETLAPDAAVWKTLDYRKRLTTSVNGIHQQLNFDVTLGNAPFETQTDGHINVHLENLRIITDLLNEDEDLSGNSTLAEEFAGYLASRVYFVVIETRAPLSKTLQIFDSINTSGMDLSGGDIFKIRYYEFLRERTGADELVFNHVCALYERIAAGNREQKNGTIKIDHVLTLAQQILITDYGLSAEARRLEATTFFERLFDVTLGIQPWDNFPRDKCGKIALPLDFFNQLIDTLFQWKDEYPKLETEAYLMVSFIGWSRYSNFHYLPAYFLYRFRNSVMTDAVFKKDFEEFIIEYSKLLLVHSVRARKITNEGRRQVREVMGKMACDFMNLQPRDLIDHIARVRNSWSHEVAACLTNECIAEIPKAKKLLCQLTAMFHEINTGKNKEDYRILLFDTAIDIEHIEASGHADRTWEGELNRLGNLISLEFGLNRSLQHKDYATYKRHRYLTESYFCSVKNFAEKNSIWTAELARERREALAKQLTNYLCGPPTQISESTL